MSEQKSTIAEPQKSPGAPPKKPQPIARAQDPDAPTRRERQRQSAEAPSARRTLFCLRIPVLYTIAVVLIVLWLLGLVSGFVIGQFIHVLLVIAVVLLLVQLVTGRRVL